MNNKILSLSIFYLLVFSSFSYAENNQTSQSCDVSTILLVAEKLSLNEVSKTKEDGYPYNLKGVVSVACKQYPENKDNLIVTIATETKDNEVKDLTVAIVNTKKNTILASYKDKLEEDATLRVESGTLRIDTANYRLNEKTRAFGVDVTSGYMPNCGDGGSGSVRTLYIQEGYKIRPILNSLTMSTWMFIQQGQTRCNNADEPVVSIIEEHTVSLSMADTTSNGFRDIIVNMKGSILSEEEKAIVNIDKSILPKNKELKSYNYKSSYDGKTYSRDQIESEFWQWRDRIPDKK